MPRIEFSKEDFQRIKQIAEKAYRSIPSVRVPYFAEEVHLNAKGLEHLKFKGWNRGRPRKDQFMRLKLLHLVPELLRKSHTVQGEHITQNLEAVRTNARRERRLVPVEYHEFVGIIDGIRIRVITKRIGSGNRFFWSLIPFWRQKNRRRILFEGNPETD